MYRTLRTSYITVVSVIFFIICSTAFWYLGNIINNNQTHFSAYYSALSVTGFDLAGNARGRNTIYRVDGMTGAPRKIFTDSNLVMYSDQAKFTPSGLTITDFLEKESSVAITPAPIGTITTLDKQGKVISVRVTDKQITDANPFIKTRQSPDGTYVVTTDLTCSAVVKEGPCPMVFSFRIFDTKTFSTKTLQQKDFGVGNVAPLKIDVLDFQSDAKVLIQINSQEELNLQVLGMVDLSTGTFTELQRNFQSPTGDAGLTYTYQWLEPDGQSVIFLKRDMASDNYGAQYVRFNLMTSAFTNITPILKYYPDVLDRNLAGYYYQNNGEWYHNFTHNSDRQITIAGEVQHFDPTSRFVPVTIFTTNNGLGPKKVVIQDLRTNKARILFNQVVGEMREPADSKVPEANKVKVGSIIYTFLGIEQ